MSQACPYCPAAFDVSDDFTPFLAHVDACAEARADELAAANPHWPAPLVAFFHPRAKPFGRESLRPSGGAGAAPAAAAAGAAADALFTSHDGSEVVPGVFITSLTLGRDPEWLRANGIGVVVNCIDRREARALTAEQQAAAGLTAYEALDMDDAFKDGYAARIDAGVAALAAGRAAGARVLVHCAAGVSRSGTVLVAYLLAHGGAGGGGMPLADALALARARRGAVYPARSFIRHLREREVALRGESSVPEALLELMAESAADRERARRAGGGR